MKNDTRYWFPTKRYGWGWGMPNCWQGWVVLFAYIAALCLAPVLFPPHLRQLPFLGMVTLASVALLAVCALKGEPPRWRWGRD